MITFSIIVPTYNRAALIQGTLRSLLAMQYPQFEIIVVDDGGKDNTEEVVKKMGDPRIKYFKKENGERGAARNYGVLQANGDYITFLDSDDLVYPNHLQEAIKLIEQYNHPEIFHLAHEWKTPEGKIIKKGNDLSGDLNERLLSGNLFSCIGVFILKEIILANPFSEIRKLSGTEDWLLWLKLAARYKIYYSNVVTSALINHDERSVLGFSEQAMLDRTNLLEADLATDAPFMQKYGNRLSGIRAHMYSYIAIHLAISGQRAGAVKFLLKAGTLNGKEFFTRRALAIVKHTLLSPFF